MTDTKLVETIGNNNYMDFFNLINEPIDPIQAQKNWFKNIHSHYTKKWRQKHEKI